MKIYKLLFMLCLLPVLAFSQETFDCEIDGEVMPSWVCSIEDSDDDYISGIGIGSSYDQALILGLCEINSIYQNTSLYNKDENRKVSKQMSKHYFGKNIFVNSLYKGYSHKNKQNIDGVVSSYRCRVGIETEDSKIFIDEKSQVISSDNIASVTTGSNYFISSKLNLEETLIQNGIEIEKTVVSKKHKFYVLLKAKKSIIKGKHNH